MERRFLALEVWDQHFDAALRPARARLADRVRKNRRAAIGKVVAVHRRDDDVREAEGFDRLSDADAFVGVGGCRASVRDGAVGARARADVAENHERGGAVVPAFADVGAVRFLAHGVEIELAHQALEPRVVRRAGRADFQPLGFRRPRTARRHERNEMTHLLLIISADVVNV